MSGRITKRTVDALKPGELVWDAHVKGFGVRRQKDAISYFFRYRAGKGRSAVKRYMTIGLHGAEGWIGGERITWTPDTAARQARQTRLLRNIMAGTPSLVAAGRLPPD